MTNIIYLFLLFFTYYVHVLWQIYLLFVFFVNKTNDKVEKRTQVIASKCFFFFFSFLKNYYKILVTPALFFARILQKFVKREGNVISFLLFFYHSQRTCKVQDEKVVYTKSYLRVLIYWLSYCNYDIRKTSLSAAYSSFILQVGIFGEYTNDYRLNPNMNNSSALSLNDGNIKKLAFAWRYQLTRWNI